MTTEEKINEILEAFRINEVEYRREAVEAAMAMEAEITPHLIEILEAVLKNPGDYADHEDRSDHIYALMLLGHFKTRQAHKLIVDVFSLPDRMPDEIFGDICTEDLPVILLNTCGGDLGGIKSLVLNREADDYCRAAACQALTYAVAKGDASRQEVVDFFGTLFSEEEAEEGADFWGLLMNIACDLCPAEIVDTIRGAFENNLIYPGFAAYEDFETILAEGQETALQRLKNNLERRSLDDLHGAMSWWACFQKDGSDPDDFSPTMNPMASKPADKTKKQKAKAKKKRKQAKAARKKNRK